MSATNYIAVKLYDCVRCGKEVFKGILKDSWEIVIIEWDEAKIKRFLICGKCTEAVEEFARTKEDPKTAFRNGWWVMVTNWIYDKGESKRFRISEGCKMKLEKFLTEGSRKKILWNEI